MNRKQGYYWVRTGEDWEIAFYNDNGYWKPRGTTMSYSDKVWDEIDENVIERN